MTKFKIGDEIRIRNACNLNWINQRAKIVKIKQHELEVQIIAGELIGSQSWFGFNDISAMIVCPEYLK